MALRLTRSPVVLRKFPRLSTPSYIACKRCLSSTACRSASQASNSSKTQDLKYAGLVKAWQKYRGVDDLLHSGANNVQIGFLGKKRTVSKQLSFADLNTPSGETIQICSNANVNEDIHAQFRQIPALSPVVIETRQPTAEEQSLDASSKVTVYLESIRPLNSVPKDLIVTPEVVFPPNKRHLQLRFHPELHARLEFRSWFKNTLHKGLMDKGFTDIETPTLFKSTSEGAREFLIPTRQKGKAYALTQSPQQYKQILMGSGISRYMQWARCYRDEDLRADRQPEFSQLDMEWAFAGSATVRKDITDLILRALSELKPSTTYQDVRDQRIPMVREINPGQESGPDAHQFSHLTFAECINSYGTDKPDLRIPNKIHAIKDLEPYRNFVGMITHLPNPRIEGFVFNLENSTPDETRKLVFEFMEGLPPAISENTDGKPQALVYDTSKPLCGFSSLGFEFESVLDQLTEGKELNDGDVVIFQARPEPEGQYCSASTKIGDIRSALWTHLVELGQLKKPRLGEPGSLQFLWVTEFPMFKPSEEGEPGQGGASGFAAAHHPFTAPLSEQDLELLFSSPLDAKSAAYDLVLNGVEIGGGSERIHIAEIQEFIMRDILLMDDARVKDFSHLFAVLQSGCPPHAGFALGFDRLTALLTDTNSVRDVIAFPKTMKGEDLFVKSPGKISNEHLAPYGLRIGSSKE